MENIINFFYLPGGVLLMIVGFSWIEDGKKIRGIMDLILGVVLLALYNF